MTSALPRAGPRWLALLDCSHTALRSAPHLACTVHQQQRAPHNHKTFAATTALRASHIHAGGGAFRSLVKVPMTMTAMYFISTLMKSVLVRVANDAARASLGAAHNQT
jgi:hypothetical protein